MKKLVIVLGWIMAGSLMAEVPTLAKPLFEKPAVEKPACKHARVHKVRVAKDALEFSLENDRDQVFRLARVPNACSKEMQLLQDLTNPELEFCVEAAENGKVIRMSQQNIHRFERSVLVDRKDTAREIAGSGRRKQSAKSH